MAKKIRLAIVGATGAVGSEFINLLVKRNFPVESLRLLASKNSAGKIHRFKDKDITIEETNADSFKNIDLAFFSAGASRSLEFAPLAVKSGAIVIDNSSAFRMDQNVPLVVPECNPEAIKSHSGIIANPNCATIQLMVAVKPLHDFASLNKLIVATYQAVSGTGQAAIGELDNQTKQFAKGEKIESKVYPYQIFNNLIPHIDSFLDNGYTKEEMKMVNESHKILNNNNINISATCVRVPVFRSHSEAVWATFDKNITVADALKIWSQAKGIKVINEKTNYPMPYFASGTNYTYVGRVRENLAEKKSIAFWCVADQLLKGAALNAIEIAENINW